MQPPPSDDVESWPTGRLLSSAARLVEHDWNAHLAAWDLNHAGLAALHALGAGPLTQREIATRVQVEDQTVSRTLERLERCGYVQRARDPGDRRRVVVTLTAEGGRTCLRASDAIVAEGFFAQIVDDVESLRRALVRIVRARSQQRWPSACQPRRRDAEHHDDRNHDAGQKDAG